MGIALLNNSAYLCGAMMQQQNQYSMFIDLNTCTKEDFVNTLICSDDADEFYTPREKELLSMDFDLQEMIAEFESWMIGVSETN